MGVPGRRSRGLIRAGLPVVAAAGTAVLVAACGSQAATTSSATQPASTASPAGATGPGSSGPGSSGTPGGVALCSDQAAVTPLVVSRVSALPQNHLQSAVRSAGRSPGFWAVLARAMGISAAG